MSYNRCVKWRLAPCGFSKYRISSKGDIESCKRGSWNKIKPQLTNKRYWQFNAYDDNGIRHRILVHRWVAFAFLGPCPDFQEVCHGIKGREDNSVGNLRYDTHEGNLFDATKLSKVDVQFMRWMRDKWGFYYSTLGRIFNISRACAANVASRRSYRQIQDIK